MGALVVKFRAGEGEELGSEGGAGAGVLFGDAIIRKHKELSRHRCFRGYYFVLIVRWMMLAQVSTST